MRSEVNLIYIEKTGDESGEISDKLSKIILTSVEKKKDALSSGSGLWYFPEPVRILM